MNLRSFQHPWSWTTLAPLGCAVHCVTAPALAAVAPAFEMGARWEWGFLALTFVVGALAIFSGLRSHRNPWPLAPILLGVAAWTGSLLHLYHPLPEDVTTTAAALTAATGLLWNSRLLCETRGVPCSACTENAAALAGSSHGSPVEKPVSG